MSDLLCGCGKPARYETHRGMACNKYIRCPTYEELRELLEVLTREMMRTDATLEKLRELRKITPQDMQQEYT